MRLRLLLRVVPGRAGVVFMQILLLLDLVDLLLLRFYILICCLFVLLLHVLDQLLVKENLKSEVVVDDAL